MPASRPARRLGTEPGRACGLGSREVRQVRWQDGDEHRRLALLVGFQTRRIAVVSGLMLLAFALGMTMGLVLRFRISVLVLRLTLRLQLEAC